MRFVPLRSRSWSVLAVAAPFALAALAPAGPLLAQAVRGRLLEAGSDAPVAGALVELRTSADSVVGSVLTDDGGRFALQAAAAGTYRLHAERIGYADWDSDPFSLGAGQSASRTIRVPAHPISLTALSVKAERQCRLARDQGEATARVWAEVRKALRFTLLSERDELYRYIQRDYARELDEHGEKVRSEAARVDTTLRARPYRPVPAEQLASEGFVSGTIEKGRIFYAPGAETLLSDAFLSTHCIEVEGTRHVFDEHWIEVRFEPIPDRTVPDIAGSLWLAADGSELRELDFRYVHVDLPRKAVPRHEEELPRTLLPSGSRGVGGDVTFARLPSGRWIIRDWEITMPELGATSGAWKALHERAVVLTGLRRRGGEVLQVAERDGKVLFDRNRATLGGVVFDSTRGTRLAGALVRLEGTGHVDTTDANGRFAFAGLDEGELTAVVRAPRLDSLGVDSLAGGVTLREGSVTEAVFGVPSWRSLLARRCEASGGGEGTDRGILVGRVQDADSGQPLAGARLSVVVVGDSAGHLLQPAPPGPSAAAGTFAFCGLPAPSTLSVSVRAPGRPPVEARVRFQVPDTLVWDVPVPTAAPVGVEGVVSDATTGRPVQGAAVLLSGLEGSGSSLTTQTDASGHFHVTDADPGRYVARVEAPGYGTAADTVQVEARTGLRLEVHLGSRVLSLTPIHVRVVGRQPRYRSASAFSRKANRLYELDHQKLETLAKQTFAVKDLIRRMNTSDYDVVQFYSQTGMDAGVCVQSRRRDPLDAGCAAVFLNDIQLTQVEASQELEWLSPEELCDVELIPSVEAGARFGTGAMYGALLLYTKPCQ